MNEQLISIGTTNAREAERQQFLSDILHTSIEGGIDYWALYSNIHLDGDRLMAIKIRPDEPSFDRFDPRDGWQTIDTERVWDALVKVCSGASDISTDRAETIAEAMRTGDAGMIDADLADCIVQIAAFGEIVFG